MYGGSGTKSSIVDGIQFYVAAQGEVEREADEEISSFLQAIEHFEAQYRGKLGGYLI